MTSVSALPGNPVAFHSKAPTTGVPEHPAPSGYTEPDNGRSMKMESERLKTFTGWPSQYVRPTSLASAGFYFLKQEDLVRCAFCGIEIGKWEEGDDAMTDHRKWSPDCDFVRRLECGNVPIGGEPSDAATGEDTCGKYGIEMRPNSIPENEPCTSHINLQKLGIQLNRGPSYPDYAVLTTRLATFTDWPKSMKQKPSELAEAGFFYTGKGDHTICFYCGGGLKNWEEHDDPWEQHALWFSKCGFLILQKTKEFVEKIRGRKGEGAGRSGASEAEKPEAKPEATTTNNNAKESDNEQSSNTMCKICFTKQMGVVFLPCGHVVACVDCAPALKSCAVCRKPLEATIRAFLT